jgi:hypothetical protein
LEGGQVTPQVGDIWELTTFWDKTRFLLIKEIHDEVIRSCYGVFDVLELETGTTKQLHMNLDLDDWEKVA